MPNVLYVGRDDFGADRYLPLRGLTGICVSGLPGYGKTSLISSWLCQLTPTPAAQFALLDGKDGGDQEPWHDRAWRHAGDQLADALEVLEDVHAEMRRRLRSIVGLCGQRNAWNASGPTDDLPLLMTVIDECQTYLDIAQHKGDRAMESLARRCIALVGELIRKGRSVLCLTVLATQKTTGDSIPTSLRDNSGLAVSFALKTTRLRMSTEINDDRMTLEIDGHVIATAEFREHAAADGRGAWIVSSYPSRLFTRNQAITAMVLAERLAAGYSDDDRFVIGWREELSL